MNISASIPPTSIPQSFLEEFHGVHRVGQNLDLVQGIKGLVFERQGVVIVAMDEVQTMIHLGDVGIPGLETTHGKNRLEM